jgi:hypothetical protein
MAQLAIALAGAGAAKLAVGAGVLAASYAGVSTVALGYTTGSILGSMFFGPKAQSQQGPRLQDLSVQGSAYGNFIPITYGSIRVAGNIIWATDIVERKTTKKVSGGKGGSSQKVTTFSYFSNFATLLCEGEITSVQRIWADGRLIYDTSAGNTGITGASSKIRIYKGTETQMPDPFIQSVMGIDDTPAYRGRAYVVFESLALAEFGNRIPNMTFEVIRGSEFIPNITYFDRDTEILPSPVSFSGWQSLDLDSRVCWWVGTQTISGITYNRLNATNIDTGTLFYEQFFEREPNPDAPTIWFREFNAYNTNLANTGTCAFVPASNELWIAGARLSDQHFVHDAYTGRELARIQKPAGFGVGFDYGFVSYNKYSNVVIFHTDDNAPRAIIYDPFFRTSLTGIINLTSAIVNSSVLAFSPINLGSLMWAGAYNSTAPLVVRELPNSAVIGSGTFEDFIRVAGEIPNATPFRNMFYDETRELMIVVNSVIGTPSQITIRAYTTNGTFTKVAENTFNGTLLAGSAFHSENTDLYLLCQSTVSETNIYYINPVTLDVNFIYEGGPTTDFNVVRDNPIVNIDRGHALGGIGAIGSPKIFARVPLGKRTLDDPVPLNEIVEDISLRAGLEPSEIDTSAMNELVDGFVITKQSPARAALEPLMTAYFYNSTESSL